ncbi:MAG: Alpha-glucosidase [Thermoleophilia bacterium]|nr:Alpha-glucosidase [Thermoleophilia bacterium]
MFDTQQLSPLVRRIHVPRPGAKSRLPDPALGDRGRAQRDAEPVVQHASLAAALAGVPCPLTEVGYDVDGHVRIRVALAPGERLYGASDADAKGLERRGDHVHLVNEIHPRGSHLMVGDCEYCDSHGIDGESVGLEIGGRDSNYGELLLPFTWSTNGWALYISNAHHGAVLDLGLRDPDVLAYDSPGGDADVYVLGPGDPATLVSEFVRLTGNQPLPPTWALGFLQSRFGYESFAHVHRTLDRFEEEALPVHGVIFDVQWLEDHVNLRWDPRHFPEPSANIRRLAERGVRSMVITEPGTRVGASNHAGGVARAAFATDAAGEEFDSKQWYALRGIPGYRDIEHSPGALLNVFREDAADWWYHQHVPLLDQGIDAWWLDLNEPEDVSIDVRFRGVDWPQARDELSGAEARNLFAIAQQRLFTRRDRAGTTRRPFLLSRSGSAGSQRYGAAPWTGDVGATWEDLALQARLMLNAGMCGMPLTGSDVGGFNGDPGPELFARWMQLGSVTPIFRAHGCMEDREPWSQGPDALEAIRPSLVLRAQLLPSIASWAQHALRGGEPLLRPMLLGPVGTGAGSDEAARYADDARWADVDDQFFFGPLLAAPVVEEGATTRRVELPAGQWADVWTGMLHEGGGSIEVPTPLDALPLFVEATTLLVTDPTPLARRGQSWPPSELVAWSFAPAGVAASTTFYLDDGISRMHEQGAYCLQQLEAVDGAITARRLGGSWPSSRIRCEAAVPGRIEADGA